MKMKVSRILSKQNSASMIYSKVDTRGKQITFVKSIANFFLY